MGVAVISIMAVEYRRSLLPSGIFVQIEQMPDGHSWITEADVMKSLERSFVYKLDEVPIGEIDFERVERELEDEPFIKDAEVYADAGQRIHIELTQRKPLLRVIDGRGDNYYLDEEGKKMPLSKHFSARVVAATGAITPFTPDYLNKKKHRVKDLFELATYIKGDNFLDALIDQIYVREDGEMILVPKMGRQDILIGSLDNLDAKVQNLKAFYQYITPYEGWQKYHAIDLRFKGQVVCQKN